MRRPFLAALILLAGCGAFPPSPPTGFIGAATSPVPEATGIAREVLARGGGAADAAISLAAILAVTLPSRASLGARGACLLREPGQAARRLDFTSPTTPLLPRALFFLHEQDPRLPFGDLLLPAEHLARRGFAVRPALAADIAQAKPFRMAPGDLVQPVLGATLARLRLAGVGDLYAGRLAQAWRDGDPTLPPPESLRQALPSLELAATDHRDGMSMSRLPLSIAGTAFATLDRRGGVVLCALTLDGLFGEGRPNALGIYPARPAPVPPAGAAALIWDDRADRFRAILWRDVPVIACAGGAPSPRPDCRLRPPPGGLGLSLGGEEGSESGNP